MTTLCLVSFAYSEQPANDVLLLKERIYKMKAVFLFNFTRYIEWPENDTSDNFIIAVLGESYITEPLNIIATKRKVGDKNIVVKQYNRIDNIKPFHILFIDSTFNINLNTLHKIVGNQNILMVGDREGLAEKGSGISFFIKEGKVKFELNRKIIEDANLTVSSQLLKIAKLIK